MSVAKEIKVEATVVVVSKQNLHIKGPVRKIWIKQGFLYWKKL